MSLNARFVSGEVISNKGHFFLVGVLADKSIVRVSMSNYPEFKDVLAPEIFDVSFINEGKIVRWNCYEVEISAEELLTNPSTRIIRVAS